MKKPVIITISVVVVLVIAYFLYQRQGAKKKADSGNRTNEGSASEYPDINIGNSTPEPVVRAVQELINKLIPNSPITVDGYFGEQTQQALADIGYPGIQVIGQELYDQLEDQAS